MEVNIKSDLFSPEAIAKIEKMKNAKYVCETCLRAAGGGWANQPVAIFYNNDPANVPAGGSRWFGLYYLRRHPDEEAVLMITNALSAVEEPIEGVVADDGEVIYSRYRHDYRTSKDGSVWIDGGRDYVRTGLNFKPVTLQIKEGELCVVS